MLIDFKAIMPDELTVAAGDVVKGVSKAGEEGWLQGELGGKKGIFPANFVKVCLRRRALAVIFYLHAGSRGLGCKPLFFFFLMKGGASIPDR